MGCSTTPEGTVVNFKDKEYIHWDEGVEYDSNGNKIHHINSKGDEEWYEYEYDSNDKI